MTLDHPGMKLGRLPSPPEKRMATLGLSNYLEILPRAPLSLDLTQGVPRWPMYLNDRMGDCTAAAMGHMEEVWSAQVDRSPTFVTDEDVLTLYGLCNNGVDQGADMLKVLSVCRNVGLAGNKILGYVDVRVHNLELIKVACWLFGGLYLGVNLPQTAQIQVGQSQWSVVPNGGPQAEAGSWGGHAINMVQFDTEGCTVPTWGALQRMTWDFFSAYCDEAYAVIPGDYDRLLGKALDNGFKLDDLKADLPKLGGQVNR